MVSLVSRLISLDKPKIKRKYPYIGKFKSTTVLFSGPSKGIVLYKSDYCSTSENDYFIGEYRDDWIEINFEISFDEVTLCMKE